MNEVNYWEKQLKNSGYNVAGDVAEALNAKVEELVKAAAVRAEANGRKTLMAKDF